MMTDSGSGLDIMMERGDDLFSMWYEPFQDKWRDLGYNHYFTVEQEFGDMFFNYDPGAENRAEAKAVLAKQHLESGLVNSANKAQLEYDMKERLNQFESSLEQEKSTREMELLKNQDKSANIIKTLDALSNMGVGTMSPGSSVRSGSFDVKKKMQIDSIKTQLDASMASSAFKRKSNRLKMDKIKDNVGHYDEDGWVPGSELTDLEAIMSRDAELRASTVDRQKESIDLELAHQREALYEDWIAGSMDMFSTIMSRI